jgi:hypothetical protein
VDEVPVLSLRDRNKVVIDQAIWHLADRVLSSHHTPLSRIGKILMGCGLADRHAGNDNAG